MTVAALTTMSPAQKAWATRRAQGWIPKAKASNQAAKIIAPADKSWLAPKPIAPPIDAMDPVTEFEFIQLWVDHPDAGCGFLRFIVLDRGHRKVRLFYPSRLTTIVVNRDDFDRHHTPARKANRQTIADIIRRNRALADRINDEKERDTVPDGGIFAVRALELVTGEARQ